MRWYLLLPSLLSIKHLSRAEILVYQEHWVSWATYYFLEPQDLGLVLLFPG